MIFCPLRKYCLIRQEAKNQYLHTRMPPACSLIKCVQYERLIGAAFSCSCANSLHTGEALEKNPTECELTAVADCFRKRSSWPQMGWALDLTVWPPLPFQVLPWSNFLGIQDHAAWLLHTTTSISQMVFCAG